MIEKLKYDFNFFILSSKERSNKENQTLHTDLLPASSNTSNQHVSVSIKYPNLTDRIVKAVPERHHLSDSSNLKQMLIGGDMQSGCCRLDHQSLTTGEDMGLEHDLQHCNELLLLCFCMYNYV